MGFESSQEKITDKYFLRQDKPFDKNWFPGVVKGQSSYRELLTCQVFCS